MLLPRHITRAGYDLIIIQESAAGEIAGVAWQLPAHTHIALPGLEAVDGTDVVQSAACHVAARGSIGTRHHPATPQWNRMHLKIPDI